MRKNFVKIFLPATKFYVHVSLLKFKKCAGKGLIYTGYSVFLNFPGMNNPRAEKSAE